MNSSYANVTDISPNTRTENVPDAPYSHMYEADMLIILKSVLVFVISAVGTGGNSFVILVYLRSLKLYDATSKFILNLTASDLITAVYITVYEIGIYIDPFGSYFYTCVVSEQILTCMMFVSQAVIAVATFDRFIAICYHVQYSKIMRNGLVLLLLLAAWIIPICLASLPLFGFNNFGSIPVCIYHYLLPNWMYVTYSAFMITLMGIPFLMYIRILGKAWEFYRRLDLKRDENAINNAENLRLRERRKAIKNGKVIGMVTLTSIVCWLPFQIVQCFFGTYYNDDEQTLSIITYYLGILNCTINPFIYSWQKKEFRKEVAKLVSCVRCCKDETSQSSERNVKENTKGKEGCSSDGQFSGSSGTTGESAELSTEAVLTIPRLSAGETDRY